MNNLETVKMGLCDEMVINDDTYLDEMDLEDDLDLSDASDDKTVLD